MGGRARRPSYNIGDNLFFVSPIFNNLSVTFIVSVQADMILRNWHIIVFVVRDLSLILDRALHNCGMILSDFLVGARHQ